MSKDAETVHSSLFAVHSGDAVASPKISVVVPVYKVEKYLRECVESVLAQTFTDFELILVDDGSPDNSGAICDEFAARDSRVRVFHKENGGVVEARFFGLNQAKGDYVIFLDSDDSWTRTALSGLWAATDGGRVDYVRASFMYENSARKIYDIVVPPMLGEFPVAALLAKPFRTLFDYTAMCVWGGFYQRKIVLAAAADIGDVKINYFEDGLFAVAIFLHAETAAFTRDPFYYYLQRDGSALHSFNPRVVGALEHFCEAMERILVKSGKFSRERVEEIVGVHCAEAVPVAFSKVLRASSVRERHALALELRGSTFFQRAKPSRRKNLRRRVMFFLLENLCAFEIFAFAKKIITRAKRAV